MAIDEIQKILLKKRNENKTNDINNLYLNILENISYLRLYTPTFADHYSKIFKWTLLRKQLPGYLKELLLNELNRKIKEATKQFIEWK